MTRILIAIDGSKASTQALDYVVNRKRGGAKVDVVVVNVQPLILPRGRIMTRAMIAEYQAHQREKVFAPAAIAAKIKALKADVYSETGDAAETIIALARKAKCDEIVMGSRGLGGVKGVLLGSVANKVVQLSPVPVVIVK